MDKDVEDELINLVMAMANKVVTIWWYLLFVLIMVLTMGIYLAIKEFGL